MKPSEDLLPHKEYAWPLTLRLMRHRKGPLLAFILLYALGLSGFLLTEGLWRRLSVELTSKGREILEGDLQIQSRRPFTEREAKALDSLLPPGTRHAEAVGFLSMIAGPSGQSRLVQVKAMSRDYPLAGNFSFQETGFERKQFGPGKVLFPAGLGASLGIGRGDSVKLGERSFQLAATYLDRPGGGFDFWELGGRIYIPLDDMAATGLDQKGSRIFRYRFYALPNGFGQNEKEDLRQALRKALDDPEFEVRFAGDRDTDLGRLLDNVGGFLKILALCAYLLAALGAAFFFAHHLEAERRQHALLRVIGITPFQIRNMVIQQNALLALLAFFLAAMLAGGLSLLLPWAMQQAYGVEVGAGIPWKTLAVGMLLAPITSMLFSASALWQAGAVPPGLLLRPADPPAPPRKLVVLFRLLQGAFLFGTAFAVSQSWILATTGLAAMAVALILLTVMGMVALALVWKIRARFAYADRVLLGQLRLRRGRALIALLALGFTAFAVGLLPQLRASLLAELSGPKTTSLPDLFLFDIQEDQEGPLADTLRAQGHTLQNPSPMVRARLLAVNGQVWRKDSVDAATLEGKQRQAMRSRGFNLSWRSSPSDAEEIVAGQWFSGTFQDQGIPEVSVEKSFASRLNLELRDTLRFDVQGVEIEGVITSLRRVRWNSFQPNFFVLFQPGALDLAPRSTLATAGGMSAEEATRLRDILVRAFPNVTVLEVREALARVAGMLSRLQNMVNVLSAFFLAVGLFTLAVVVEALSRDVRRSFLLLRALGTPRRALAWALARHFIGYAALAGLGGWGLSVVAAAGLTVWFWDMPFRFSPGAVLAMAMGTLGAGLFATILALRRGLSGKLRDLLAETRGQ